MMSHQTVGMILIYLQMTASKEGIHILQSPAQLWLQSGQTAWLNCNLSKEEWSVSWYREQGQNIQWIYQSLSYAHSEGRYSNTDSITENHYSLIISNAQKNDSGIYYCSLFQLKESQLPNFGNGTRLIVTDAPEPTLSILVPSSPDDAEFPPVVPVLCLLSDFTHTWNSVLWDSGEEESEGQMDAGAIDGNGGFSVWSLTTIPSETWSQKTNYTCTAKETSTGRQINATFSKETGDNCMILLCIGLPCIFILLLIQLFILLWRKCPLRGRTVERGNQIPMRQMPQTEYAALSYNRDAPLQPTVAQK